jgi:RimJ/RimL family protein N-acetyltransferase
MPHRLANSTFTTARLTARTLQPGDEEFLAALDSDPEVMHYIHTGPLSQTVAMDWAKMQVEMAPGRWRFKKWLVELRADAPTRIGWVELSKFRGVFDPAESRMGDDVNLGYEFARAYWRQGFAAEAIHPVLGYAFQALELDRLVAFVRPDNGSSVRLLERLGFQRHAARSYRDEGGHECLVFALKAESYLAI